MIAVISPTRGAGEPWSQIPPANFYESIDVVTNWDQVDVVVFDLHGQRIGTSSANILLSRVIEAVKVGTSNNRDSLWILVSGPAMGNEVARMALEASRQLLGHQDAVMIVDEPSQLASVLPEMQGWFQEIARIDALPITLYAPRGLAPAEWRCVRRLLSSVHGAELTAFGHGQGGALTLRVERTLYGAQLPRQVMKVGSRRVIEQEHERHQAFVQDKLGNFRYPQHGPQHIWYCGNFGALVYSYVGGANPKPLGEAMQTAGADCTAEVTELFTATLSPWLEMHLRPSTTITGFIDSFMRGDTLAQAKVHWNATPTPAGVDDPTDWIELLRNREITLNIPLTIAHGDLHGYNVLVDEDRHTWLIDFFWTSEYCGLFDFAFADVYLLLHKISIGAAELIPATIDAIRLSEQQSFAGGASIRPELSRIREAMLERWGHANMAAFHLARACIALRLLRYESTEPARAKLVASMAASEARRLSPEWDAASTAEDLTL